MLLSENMQGFNSRNPFVIQCSTVKFDIDNSLLKGTKDMINRAIKAGILFVMGLALGGFLLFKVLHASDYIIAHFLMVGLVLFTVVGSCFIAITTLIMCRKYYTNAIHNTARQTADETLESILSDTAIANNERIFNVIGLLQAFLGFLKSYDDFFKFINRAIVGMYIFNFLMLIPTIIIL